MEKFKEKKIVVVFESICMISMIIFLISLFLVIFSDNFLLGFLILPFTAPFAILSIVLSDKSKYTSKFLIYMRDKLNKAITLNELLEIEKEFKYLAIKDKMYCLSYPYDLKDIHKEINSKIDILIKQKQLSDGK